MILLTHIFIAVSSLILTSASIFWPSSQKLRASYALITGTLASGTYLVVLNPSSLKQSCISGLIYTSIALIGVIKAQSRLREIKVLAKSE